MHICKNPPTPPAVGVLEQTFILEPLLIQSRLWNLLERVFRAARPQSRSLSSLQSRSTCQVGQVRPPFSATITLWEPLRALTCLNLAQVRPR